MFNDLKKLESLIKNNNIGVIIMEVSRNYLPKNDFLKKVRDLANKNKIVLIFDECSSGFRETLGGIHLKYQVNPDICMFGKALGNGYAITSIIGKRKLWKKHQIVLLVVHFGLKESVMLQEAKPLKLWRKQNLGNM